MAMITVAPFAKPQSGTSGTSGTAGSTGYNAPLYSTSGSSGYAKISDKNQYLIIKIKDEFQPEVLKECKELQIFTWEIHYIEKKFLRKLKVQKIDKHIISKDKELLDVLLDERYVKMLSYDETVLRVGSGYGTGSFGISGSSGISGT